MPRDTRQLSVSTLLVVLALATPSCVIVSSSTSTPPRPDAGVDSGEPSQRDAQVDAQGGPVLTREEATRGLLESLGTNVILPTYRELATRLAALETATAAYASSRSDADRDAAREAWIAAMDPVERAELFQLGPAGMAVPEIAGGQGLRDRIYTFPVNRCLVDTVAQRGTYQDLEMLAARPTYMRGLAAVEYYLFYPGTEHNCDPAAPERVDDEAWAALGPEGVQRVRAEAALANVRLARAAADELLSAWEPSGGDFAGQLARAGESGSVYPTTQAALNAIYWAMFYADRGIKDMKLAVPTGLSELCGAASCPSLLESRYAHRSTQHLVPNLVALQQIFLGGPEGTEAIGFDDLLRAIGQDAIAIDIALALADAITAAEALPSVDETTFATHEPALEAMHGAVKRVTDLLKVDLAGTLALSPPPGAGQDND